MNKVINQLKMHGRRMMENDKQQEDDGCPARGSWNIPELSGMGRSIPGDPPGAGIAAGPATCGVTNGLVINDN